MNICGVLGKLPEAYTRLPPKQCMPKMISYLSHKYGDEKPHDQIVAIAASECGVSRKNDYGLDIGIRAALQLAHYKEKYPHFQLKDNLMKTYHKIKKTNDFVAYLTEVGEEDSIDSIFFNLAQEFDFSNDFSNLKSGVSIFRGGRRFYIKKIKLKVKKAKTPDEETEKELGEDLTEDYPVEGYERTSKTGKAHKVKAHERGTGKTAREKAWEVGSEKYPGKSLYISETGNIYVRVAEGKGTSKIAGNTAKAIKVIGYGWVPRSVSFVKGKDPRYAEVYVRDWFYDKNPVEEKLKNERIRRWTKAIKEEESNIQNLKTEQKNRGLGKPDPELSHLSDKDILDAISYFTKEKARWLEQIAGESNDYIEQTEDMISFLETIKTDMRDKDLKRYQEIEKKINEIGVKIYKIKTDLEPFLGGYLQGKIPERVQKHLDDLEIGERLMELSGELHGITYHYQLKKEMREFGKNWKEQQKQEKLVKEYKEYQEYKEEIKDKKPWEITEIIKKKRKGKGWHGEPERHSKARKTGKADLTKDVAGKPGRPRSRGLKAGTPGAMVSGAKRTKTGQALKESRIGFEV